MKQKTLLELREIENALTGLESDLDFVTQWIQDNGCEFALSCKLGKWGASVYDELGTIRSSNGNSTPADALKNLHKMLWEPVD